VIYFQQLVGISLCLFPKKWISNIFGRKYGVAPNFYFSGRVALYQLALSVRKKGKNRVLLPEYVCNVVYEAFHKAGYEILLFKLSSELEPDQHELEDLMETYQGQCVICLAPIMGAEGGLSWATSKKVCDIRKKYSVTLFLDLCQSFMQVELYKSKDLNDFAVISSFNNKSFPGLMGSAVWTDINDASHRPANLDERLLLLRLLIYKFLGFLLMCFRKFFSQSLPANISSEKFEYSYCQKFPYDFEHSGASKMQIAIGAAGILFLPLYLNRKRRDLELSSDHVIKTPYYFWSPYVLVRDQFNSSYRKLKNPYALDRNPNKSLRPRARAFHFKGFMDF
jgi:hypothetical protein